MRMTDKLFARVGLWLYRCGVSSGITLDDVRSEAPGMHTLMLRYSAERRREEADREG